MQYDHLIVGAGSAGATLAARLSAAGRQVLLLEAGPDYRSAATHADMRSPNPARIITAARHERFRWPALQARRTAVQAPRLYWRGRGVGGSSAINGQIAIRAMVEDFDDWGAGWDWAAVLPYFNRLETDLRYGERSYHGNGGPIPIYRAPLSHWGPVDQALAETALEHGFPWAPDHNAPGALGVSPYAINSLDGQRVSTNDAYLEDARGRNNLAIRGDVLVQHLLFDGNRAIGVSVRTAHGEEDLHASEVLLCAGAVHSPAVLMRSGIGTADELERHGINVRADLPVGEGFQDHAMVAVPVPLPPERVPDVHFRHTNCCVRFTSGVGPAEPGDLMLVAMNRLGDGLARGAGEAPLAAGFIGVWLNRCESRGQIRLQSADPQADPFVDANMLATDLDRTRLRAGARLLFELAGHAAVRAISTPGPMLPDLEPSDAALDDWMLATAGDTQHATATCALGRVVEPDCRVSGVDGLRVIDASIMPAVPRANTHLTTVMLAERMSDVLLGRTEAPGQRVS